jgi:ubiquinone/menaquinone biosynthesis C-methylase UbiE
MSYLNFFAADCLKYIPQHKLSTKNVLVVGCGNGQDCSPFTESREVHGLDICEDIGQSFVHERVSYFKESAESMQRESNFYDLVFSVATLEHIDDLDAAFSEIYRVTKPGGLIYSVASPLWNSYEGHHIYGLFPDFPWIHLRLSPSELIEYIQKNKIDLGSYGRSNTELYSTMLPKNESSSSPIENLVDFIFSDYFNRHSASDYSRIAGGLDVSYLIRNDIWQDGESLLTSDILEKLKNKGFTKEELLSTSHTYVAIK